MDNNMMLGSFSGWLELIKKVILWVFLAFIFGFAAGYWVAPAEVVLPCTTSL